MMRPGKIYNIEDFSLITACPGGIARSSISAFRASTEESRGSRVQIPAGAFSF